MYVYYMPIVVYSSNSDLGGIYNMNSVLLAKYELGHVFLGKSAPPSNLKQPCTVQVSQYDLIGGGLLFEQYRLFMQY